VPARSCALRVTTAGGQFGFSPPLHGSPGVVRGTLVVLPGSAGAFCSSLAGGGDGALGAGFVVVGNNGIDPPM